MRDFNIIFLAGGSSSRFAPLKEKNLYSFMGKTVIESQLAKIQNISNLSKVYIITNQGIQHEVENLVNGLEKKFDVRIFVQKGEGMAGACKTALENFDEDSEVLVANMNDFFLDDFYAKFSQMLPILREKKENLLSGVSTDTYFPGGYLIINSEDNVTGLIEKPGQGNEPSKYVKMVFDYFNSSDVLRDYMDKAQNDKDDVYEVALDNMMKSGCVFKLLKYEIAKWKTIKYPWHVLAVMNFFLNQIEKQEISPDVVIADSATIKGNVVIEKGVKIFDNAVIQGPAYIGENTIVGNNALVRDSMIGTDCVVGYCTEIARSYLASKVWTHKNYIGDSILETNISFGSNALTANLRLDEADIFVNVKGEKIATNLNKLGAIIASDVRIGVATLIMPGMKIGENSVIGSGLVISQDIESNSYVNKKSEFDIKVNTFDVKSLDRENLQNILKSGK